MSRFIETLEHTCDGIAFEKTPFHDLIECVVENRMCISKASGRETMI